MRDRKLFDARVTELTGRGLTRRQALRVARKERRAAHPLHKRAVDRRWHMAQDRRKAAEVNNAPA